MTRQDSNKVTKSTKNSHMEGAVHDYINEGRKYANELYVSGLKKMNLEEQDIEKYSDEITQKIKANPIKSVLIAGGIGFVLSQLFKK